jgi:hypothetical protein
MSMKYRAQNAMYRYFLSGKNSVYHDWLLAFLSMLAGCEQQNKSKESG